MGNRVGPEEVSKERLKDGVTVMDKRERRKEREKDREATTIGGFEAQD